MSALPDDEAPSVFHALIGGFMGPTYLCELEDGILTYTKWGPGHTPEPIQPLDPMALLAEDEFAALLVGIPDDQRAELLALRNRHRRYTDPTDADWGEALRALHKLGAGEWKERYEPEYTVCDGTGWEIEIVSPHLVVNASGDNEYPPRFNAALKIICKLLDGREFR
jgi:hypothetical protein